MRTSHSISSLLPDALIVLVRSFVIGLHVAPVSQRQIADFRLIVLQLDGEEFIPFRRVYLGVIYPLEVQRTTAGLSG
jgi:hypothetical protein